MKNCRASRSNVSGRINGACERPSEPYLEGVGVLGGSNDAEPFTHLVLLEELLGQVLEVALRERNRRGDREFASTWREQSRSVRGARRRESEIEEITLAGELDVLAELTGLSLDLDVVYEELLVSGGIEDLVVGGSRVVDEELLGGSLGDRLLLQLCTRKRAEFMTRGELAHPSTAY